MNKQPSDSSELLADIGHTNQVNKTQTRLANDRIRQRIAAYDMPEGVANGIIDEVADQLGRLKTRVKLTEKALASFQSRQRSTSAPETTPSVSSAEIAKTKTNGLRLTAEQLAGTHSPLEAGSSPDPRKLGIAIFEIRFGKPASIMARILRRLKLLKQA